MKYRITVVLPLLACLVYPLQSTASNCRATSKGLTALFDLGSSRYLGRYEGGLYPGGVNEPPPAHESEGLFRANNVIPLGINGQPSASGKYVLLSIGMSNTNGEFSQFVEDIAANAQVNHESLVVVNGAMNGRTADTWTSPDSLNYEQIRSQILAPQGLSEGQVQAVWVKVANRQPTVSLPNTSADAFLLMRQLGDIVRALSARYPNLQMVFLSSRVYAGYASTTLNPEPYAYESGFAVKWLIEAQINQMGGHGIDPRAGDLDYSNAPWLGWGPYLWADGLNARSDGLVWSCEDFQLDGTHPSNSGNKKVSQMLQTFFLGSPFTETWFRAGSLPPPAAEALVINEIMATPQAGVGSAGEWIELYNPNSFPVDINRWGFLGAGNERHQFRSSAPIIVAAGAYFVAARSGDPAQNGGVDADYVYGNQFNLDDAQDTLTLVDSGLDEIDHVAYSSNDFPLEAGSSISLRDVALPNELGENWCASATVFGAGGRGTPGADNVCAQAPDELPLVINEIMADPEIATDNFGEWIELYNPNDHDVDINNWGIFGANGERHRIQNGGPLMAPSRGYVVLGRHPDPALNGGIDLDYAYERDISLGNLRGEVRLVNSALDLVDRVIYGPEHGFEIVPGASMTLGHPSLNNELGSNWCVSASPFGFGDFGTPGERNRCP